MEPFPSGEFILDGVVISRSNRAIAFTHIAGDGAGGAFVTLDGGDTLYITSEGEFVRLGSDIDNTIATLLGVRYWQDAMRFMGDENAENARTQWSAYRSQWGLVDDPCDAVRLNAVRNTLDIEELEDAFATLYNAMRGGSDLVVQNVDGLFSKIE